MAKAKNSGAAPVNKQTTEPSTPAPVAPTTNPENNPTVVPPVADPATSDPAQVQNDTSTEPEQVEVKEGMKRAELDAVAVEAGLTNVSTYKDKAVVVAAVERVRAGEDASVVDKELTPVVDNGSSDVEVEVVSPFYDVEVKTYRKAGDKYKTSETRAGSLRSGKLVK